MRIQGKCKPGIFIKLNTMVVFFQIPTKVWDAILK